MLGASVMLVIVLLETLYELFNTLFKYNEQFKLVWNWSIALNDKETLPVVLYPFTGLNN